MKTDEHIIFNRKRWIQFSTPEVDSLAHGHFVTYYFKNKKECKIALQVPSSHHCIWWKS